MGFLGSIFAAKNEFEAKPLPGSGQFTQQNFAGALERARNPQINTGLLPTEQADQTRGAQQQFAQGLQGQAAGTAPSVAQAQLKQGVNAQNQQAATAIGSQRGINPALAARLIAQQQAQNTQGMAGQAATAGIQERQAAQALLGNALAQQRGQDIGQAQNQVQAGLGQAQVGNQAEATAQQAIANQNQQLVAQNQGVQTLNRQTASDNQQAANSFLPGLLGGVGAAAGALGMAEGGRVPGEAEVEGDSYANDKVPIMASPGEVVLPRSVASDPDKAKEFVAHLRARGEASSSKAKGTPSQGDLVKALKHLLMAHGGEVEGAEGATSTGASTGGVGSGLGGAGTGGAATGGASTGGAGTVTLTINNGSGNSKDSGKSSGGKGGKAAPTTINISHVGGTTDAGNTTSGDGPGAPGEGGTGGAGKPPNSMDRMAYGGDVQGDDMPETPPTDILGGKRKRKARY